MGTKQNAGLSPGVLTITPAFERTRRRRANGEPVHSPYGLGFGAGKRVEGRPGVGCSGRSVLCERPLASPRAYGDLPPSMAVPRSPPLLCASSSR